MQSPGYNRLPAIIWIHSQQQPHKETAHNERMSADQIVERICTTVRGRNNTTILKRL